MATTQSNPASNRLACQTAFKRDVLTVLAGLDAPSGQDIATELEEYRAEEIHAGRLYPNLDDLVEDDLVEKGQRDRRTNAYRLTEKGAEAVESRRQWEQHYLND